MAPLAAPQRSSTRFHVFRIILTNAVKYATNVESYDRRIQSAINIQGKKMQRRAEFLLKRALRRELPQRCLTRGDDRVDLVDAALLHRRP